MGASPSVKLVSGRVGAAGRALLELRTLAKREEERNKRQIRSAPSLPSFSFAFFGGNKTVVSTNKGGVLLLKARIAVSLFPSPWPRSLTFVLR